MFNNLYLNTRAQVIQTFRHISYCVYMSHFSCAYCKITTGKFAVMMPIHLDIKKKLNMFQAGTTTINVNQPTAHHALFGFQNVRTKKMDSGFSQKEVSLLCIWFVKTTGLLKQGPVQEMMHGRHKHTLITENVNIFLLFQMNIIQMVICHHARG